jgi:hypothetical protein
MADEKNTGIIFSDLDSQVIGSYDQTRTFFLELSLHFGSIVRRPVHLCTEVCQGKPLRIGFFCNLYCTFRVEVRPSRAFLPGFQSAFGNQKIRISAKQNRIAAVTGVSAVSDYLSIKRQTVPETGCGVYKREGHNREWDSMVTIIKFHKPYRERKLREWNRERFGYKCIQNSGSPDLSANHKAS